MKNILLNSNTSHLDLDHQSDCLLSAHDAITFQLLEMSSITTPNQKQFQIFTQGTLFKGFLGKISAILGSCIIKKSIWKLHVNRIVLVTGTGENVYGIS